MTRGPQRMELRVKVAHTDTACDSVPGVENDALGWTETFADWLVEDRRLGWHTDIRRERFSPGDGGMSPDLVAWISLAVASGSFVTDLISVYGHFRASLPRGVRPAARLIVEYGDTRVIVEEGTVEDVARVARALNTAHAEDKAAAHTPSAPAVTPPSAADAPPGGEAGDGPS
jgi:hypothetical protein